MPKLAFECLVFLQDRVLCWLFEPKWDGFRAIVFRDAERFYIQSCDLKPLDRYFPS